MSRRRSASSAPTALSFDLGGAAVAVTSSSARWLELATQRYGAFATAGRPEIRIRYHVDGASLDDPHRLRAARQTPPTWTRAGAKRRARGAGFAAALASTATGLELEVTGPLATYPVDLLLESLWYETPRRGLVMHAAALADGDRGWLCAGPSGSGKSTLAGLFPSAALCDELAAVELPAAGPPRLASLPFWSGRAGSARLAGIYCLRHADADSRHRLGASAALRRLCRQVVWPVYDGGRTGEALVALQELLERVPVWELGFRPATAVWQTLSRERAA